MSLPKEISSIQDLSTFCVLSGYRGSIAHGTYRPTTDPNSIDDKDIMAICVGPVSCYLGIKDYARKGTREIKEGPWDIVIYECKKFMRLLSQANPNVLSILWLDENLYIKRTEAGNMIIERRHIFATRAIYHSFTGYAHSQLKKMTTLAFEGYMGEKRKALVKKHGYDTKNASHLIRLLRMGIEFLSTGELQVMRPDAQELLSIKDGEWSLEEVKDESKRLFSTAHEALLHSPLPRKTNMDAVNELCMDVVRNALSKRE